jgi:hypothetical protein
MQHLHAIKQITLLVAFCLDIVSLHRCLPKCTKIAPETHQKSPVDDEMLEGG